MPQSVLSNYPSLFFSTPNITNSSANNILSSLDRAKTIELVLQASLALLVSLLSDWRRSRSVLGAPENLLFCIASTSSATERFSWELRAYIVLRCLCNTLNNPGCRLLTPTTCVAALQKWSSAFHFCISIFEVWYFSKSTFAVYWRLGLVSRHAVLMHHTIWNTCDA